MMSEGKDPKIKLFGKTIGLPETVEAAGICEPAGQSCDADTENSGNQTPASSMLQDCDFNGDAEDQDSQERQPGSGQDNPNEENGAHSSSSNGSNATNAPTPLADDSKEDPNNSNEKTPKKPDKILPCPRCNSTETKFCYFNNYNVNQPRHFCKNCQRYWTAGGAMRNVPVGAGRRKNKNLAASQFCPVLGTEAVQGNPNGTSFLAFGSDTHLPPCESVVPGLNTGDRTIGRNEHWNEPRKDEVPIFHGVPWPYPQHSIQWSPPMLPPSFGPTNFPLQFYSTAPPYWARPGVWNIPYVIQPSPAPSSGPTSQTLGKHPRDESITVDSETEQEKTKKSDPDKCLWVPKTLRVDDPGEASRRSSIWSTLGINKDSDDDDDSPDVGVNGGCGIFKALQRESKDDGERNEAREKSSTVLQANPAALSRFVSFHESS